MALPLVLALALSSTPVVASPAPAPADTGVPAYAIHGVRYATIRGFPVRGLIPSAPEGERIDIAMAVWVVRGGGRTVLFDTGFHRPPWRERFAVADYLRPDSAIMLAGVQPGDVTDIVVSHAHWDHMGGLDLFPDATIWIQEDEYRYYTADAWREGGRSGGIDPADVLELVRRHTAGQVRLVSGDDVEILPGLRVFTGARHTYASQYLLVEGGPPVVLASDNAYLWRNLEEGVAGATFDPADAGGNRAALARMLALAGTPERVVPGHDPAQFRRFPGGGRVVTVREGPP
ncbi:MAG TPA: N-acyl homoserine lactonase family protein [Longimicrobiales bacterium]|nr:N-acyl homoserine lactonase family protein [Longimicrobiales bacterium]